MRFGGVVCCLGGNKRKRAAGWPLVGGGKGPDTDYEQLPFYI